MIGLWINLGIIISFSIFWFWFLGWFCDKDSFWKLLSRVILIVILMDCVVTFIGRPPEYWLDYSKCVEGSLPGAMLLSLHPLSFTFGIILEVMLVTFTVYTICQSPFFLQVVFFALLIGHTHGGGWTWLRSWLQKDIEILIGREMSIPGDIFYWDFTRYISYLLLAIIITIIFRKMHRFK